MKNRKLSMKPAAVYARKYAAKKRAKEASKLFDTVDSKPRLEDLKTIVCPENEWDAVELALFCAQRDMGKRFPIEAQWFLNRLGAAMRNLVA
jgi:hypothetical protein